ncbi:MAG TPA: STAS domain-containing protein [Terriglobales bacterium]|nr:STAS domain-containing protein [Terriglobales bacterium]
MPLKLSSRSVRGVIVVDCAGRIVFGDEAAILREELKKLLQHNRSIVLNLSNVGYIDSGGLGTLVGIYTSARNLGGQIKLAGLNSRVIDLLQITKLVTVFETFKTVDQATDSFSGAAGAA